MKVVRRTVVDGPGPFWSSRRDEHLMIEKRAAKRPCEKRVGYRVVRMRRAVQVDVDWARWRVVDAHSQPSCIASRDIAILPALIQLINLLIVSMHQISCATPREAAALQDAIRRMVPLRRARRRCRRNERVD